MGRTLLILNERDPRHPRAGGAELHVAETAKQFVALGYAPTLLCSRFPGAAAAEMQDGLQVRRFGNRLTYYLALPFLVRRALRQPGTVIIEHLNKLPFCTPLYCRAPLLLLTHHLFGRTAFQQVPFPVACIVYAAEKLIPLVYRGRRFIAVSPSTRDDLITRGIAAPTIVVIPNGLDHQRYHAADRILATRPTVLVFGRIEFYKRIDLVLHAVQKLLAAVPDVRLLIVGDGSARPRLEQLAAQLGIQDRTTFAGFVPEAAKVDLLRQSHVFAATSEKEGWGLTVIEANACGVPAVASNVEGLRDAVRDGETGILVPHGDVSRLTEALSKILRDHGYRERLAAGAVDWARRFSWERTAAEVTLEIEALVSGVVPSAPPVLTSDPETSRHGPG